MLLETVEAGTHRLAAYVVLLSLLAGSASKKRARLPRMRWTSRQVTSRQRWRTLQHTNGFSYLDTGWTRMSRNKSCRFLRCGRHDGGAVAVGDRDGMSPARSVKTSRPPSSPDTPAQAETTTATASAFTPSTMAGPAGCLAAGVVMTPGRAQPPGRRRRRWWAGTRRRWRR